MVTVVFSIILHNNKNEHVINFLTIEVRLDPLSLSMYYSAPPPSVLQPPPDNYSTFPYQATASSVTFLGHHRYICVSLPLPLGNVVQKFQPTG